MNMPKRKLESAILVAITVGFVIWSAGFIYKSSFIAIDGKRYFCLFDDAMVSMRYAWNFSHGLGLVWNQGERVQGYTNLLMTLLMSFATLVFSKSAAILFIQILGAGFMLGIAYVTMKISDHMVQDWTDQYRALVRVLSFLCALSYYPLAYWSLMGMETGLLTLLLLSGVLSAFHYTKNQKANLLFLTSGYLGLAYLTRNDSIVFAVLIWAYIVWQSFLPASKADPKSLKHLLGAISFYLLFVFGQLIFQYLYYGEMLPNTYTLKLTGIPLLARIINGAKFVRQFLVESIVLLVLASLEIILDFQKRKLLLISIVFSAIGYQVYVGGEAWNYWRIMSPSVPLLIILFIVTVTTIVLAVSGTQAFRAYFLRNPIFPQRYIAPLLVVSLTAVGLISVNTRFLREISLLSSPAYVANNLINVNSAIAIDQFTTSDATVGVYWAGVIPYFTDRKAIDFLGKSDRYIAHLPSAMNGTGSGSSMSNAPGHNKYDLDYSIKTLQPVYVQGFDWGHQNLTQWAASRYVTVKYKGISLFFLKDSPSVLWSRINTLDPGSLNGQSQ